MSQPEGPSPPLLVCCRLLALARPAGALECWPIQRPPLLPQGDGAGNARRELLGPAPRPTWAQDAGRRLDGPFPSSSSSPSARPVSTPTATVPAQGPALASAEDDLGTPETRSCWEGVGGHMPRPPSGSALPEGARVRPAPHGSPARVFLPAIRAPTYPSFKDMLYIKSLPNSKRMASHCK